MLKFIARSTVKPFYHTHLKNASKVKWLGQSLNIYVKDISIFASQADSRRDKTDHFLSVALRERSYDDHLHSMLWKRDRK